MKKKNKKKQGTLIAVAAVLVCAILLGGCGGTEYKMKTKYRSGDQEPVTTAKETTETVTWKADEIKPLEELGVIAGVHDVTITTDADVKLEELIVVNKDLVEDIMIDDSKVDYNTPGTYEVKYEITFNAKKVADYEKKNNVSLNLPHDTDKVVVRTYVKVTIAENIDTAALPEGTEVITAQNKEQVVGNNTSQIKESATSANIVRQEAETIRQEQKQYEQAYIEQKASQNKEPETPTKKPEEPTQHSHKWTKQTQTVHHDTVTREEPVYTVVHHDAEYENVWVEDSPAQDICTGYEYVIECTTCFVEIYGYGETRDDAIMDASNQYRNHVKQVGCW